MSTHTPTKQQGTAAGFDTFVVGTLRGYASGVVKAGTGSRMVERLFPVDSRLRPEDYDAAYSLASRSASRLLATINRGRTDLVRDWGEIPGSAYDD